MPVTHGYHKKNARSNTQTCRVEGCETPYYAKGLCGKHYQIDRRRPGETHNLVAAKGSGWTTKDGYQKIKVAGVTRFKHHLIMEEHLGRPLTPDESVHHKNGNRSDNRLENLELRERYHGKGQSVEDKLEDAADLIRLHASPEWKRAFVQTLWGDRHDFRIS